MADGKISIQSTDNKIYTITPEVGATGAVALTLPKEGGMLTVDTEVVHKTGDETIAGTKNFTSSPTVPTLSTSDNSTKVATTNFVNTKLGDFGLGSSGKNISDANNATIGSFQTSGQIDNITAKNNNFPYISSCPDDSYVWWNIETFGYVNRIAQIANQAFNTIGVPISTYIRTKHDSTWSDWKEIAYTNSPAFTGIPTVNGIQFSGYSGFKNYIINGKKVVNQRGLTSTDNSYNQDRWYKSGLNWFQGIEGNNNLISGKTYTLSWVGVATASYYVGTATSATINAQSFTAIANGGNFTLTISAGQNLWIKFSSDATGSTFNFVQLEEGSVATPFENRTYGLELSLCQRYYEVCDSGLQGMAFSTSTLSFSTVFKVTKRVIPTMATSVFGSWIGNGESDSISSVVFLNITTTGMSVDSSNFSGNIIQGYAYVLRGGYFTASAEL